MWVPFWTVGVTVLTVILGNNALYMQKERLLSAAFCFYNFLVLALKSVHLVDKLDF